MTPRRVLLETGEAVPPARAKELGASFEIIFIRADGWSLGASANLKNQAYEMWKDQWTCFTEYPFYILKTIGDFESDTRTETKSNRKTRSPDDRN